MLTTLLLLGVARAALLATLIDQQYTTPYCSVRDQRLENAYGALTLDYDVLGRALRLRLQLEPRHPSCRLCQIAPGHCAANLSGLTLAQDTSYNVRVLALRPYGAYASQFSLPSGAAELLTDGVVPWEGDPEVTQLQGLCGARFRMVVALMLTLQRPVRRDVPVVAQDLLADSWVNCSETRVELSCRVARRYPVLDVHVTNCVQDAPIEPREPAAHSPLYWRLNPQLWPPQPLSVCGESLWALMARMRPEDWLCDGENALYVRPRPWYELALETAVAWLDGCLDQAVARGCVPVDEAVGDNSTSNSTNGTTATNDTGRRFTMQLRRCECAWMDGEVLRALDLLERSCALRATDAPLEETVLYNVTVALRDRRPTHHDAECARLPTWRNVTLPWYARHFGEWQLQLFQYLVYFDDDMPVRAALLLTTWVVAAAATLTAALALVWWRVAPLVWAQPYQLIE